MTLTTGELDRIRTDYETQILDSTCTIQTKTETSDGMGGHYDTWANTYTSVPCRLGVRTSAGNLSEAGAREVFPDEYTLNVHWDQTIAEGNRVVIGSTTYEVVHVKDTSVQWVGLRAATVKELKP
jgi:hypothetical protein